MQWSSAISRRAELADALTEIRGQLRGTLGSPPPDLVVAFAATDRVEDLEELPGLVAEVLAPRAFLGCTAAAVVGAPAMAASGRAPVLSATAASLPGVDLTTFHLQAGDLPDPDASPDHWEEVVGVPRRPDTHFVLLSSPVGASSTGPSLFDPRPLLMGLDYAYGGGTRTGGVASALNENRLFAGGLASASGCVGLALRGRLEVDPIVAQGARPIGRPCSITRCHRHQLAELDGRPAVEVLVELFHQLPPRDQLLAQHRLHLGIATTELKRQLRAGDFLVRNILQLDHESGTIAVGDRLRRGQSVQFHLRDPGAAAREVTDLLTRYRPPTGPAGALLFTCTGRGPEFFAEADGDARRFGEVLAGVPLGGVYCAGEIAPVGPATYVHGYTACFAVFRPPLS
ncbi:MAG: FIST C-terminal domain-containing protein [Gemmatimonadota bacterium]